MKDKVFTGVEDGDAITATNARSKKVYEWKYRNMRKEGECAWEGQGATLLLGTWAQLSKLTNVCYGRPDGLGEGEPGLGSCISLQQCSTPIWCAAVCGACTGWLLTVAAGSGPPSHPLP